MNVKYMTSSLAFVKVVALVCVMNSIRDDGCVVFAVCSYFPCSDRPFNCLQCYAQGNERKYLDVTGSA